MHPELFDIQDHITLEEAGSPLRDNAYYPLQAFSAADNTCRGLLGMAPSGQLPGMCLWQGSVGSCRGIDSCRSFFWSSLEDLIVLS